MCSGKIGQKSIQIRNEEITLKTENNTILRIHIYQDSLKNLYINVYDKDGHSYGSASVMFSDVVKDAVIVKPYNLSNGICKEYVIQTYDLGSTYGAQSIIIIWFDGDDWRVTRDFFQRAFIEDRDKDGIYEIVEYYHSKNKKGDIYRFKRGNFDLLR